MVEEAIVTICTREKMSKVSFLFLSHNRVGRLFDLAEAPDAC